MRKKNNSNCKLSKAKLGFPSSKLMTYTDANVSEKVMSFSYICCRLQLVMQHKLITLYMENLDMHRTGLKCHVLFMGKGLILRLILPSGFLNPTHDAAYLY